MKLPLFILLPIVFCLSLMASIVFAVEQPQVYELSFWIKNNMVESDDRLSIEIYRAISNTPTRLWIGLDGSITPETSEIDTSELTQTHCDGLDKEFDGSDYAGCWIYRDLANDKPHILGFESICT
jgi:hypothetical protein